MSVYFYGCITMDGYLEDKNHNLNWLYQTVSIESTGFSDFYQAMDITIMGKRTFQEIAKSQNASDIYPTTQNYVFTHSGEPLPNGYIAKTCDVTAFVNEVDKSKNIWVVGGSTILSPLLDCNLVDFLIIQIAPVLLGGGIPLFTQKEALARFFLKEVKKYGQFAELVYSREP